MDGGCTIAGTVVNNLSLAFPAFFNITNSSRTVTVSAPIVGSFGLTKNGKGTLTLSGANTFPDLTMSGGTVGIGIDDVFAGGVITSGALGRGTVTFGATSALTASGAAPVVHNPVILDAGLTNNG